MFLLSLLTLLKSVPPEKKMALKINMMSIINEAMQENPQGISTFREHSGHPATLAPRWTLVWIDPLWSKLSSRSQNWIFHSAWSFFWTNKQLRKYQFHPHPPHPIVSQTIPISPTSPHQSYLLQVMLPISI